MNTFFFPTNPFCFVSYIYREIKLVYNKDSQVVQSKSG